MPDSQESSQKMAELSDAEVKSLLNEAMQVKARSHAPYSKQMGGAAVATDVGTFCGCVVENCSYPLTVCAIRAAVCIALSEGATKFRGVAFIGHQEGEFPNPCGACRQAMLEMGSECPLYLGKYKDGVLENQVKTATAGTKLPGWETTSTELSKGVRPTLFSGELKPRYAWKAEGKVGDVCSLALASCKQSYAPYSSFPVGAAVLTDKGMYGGSNVEFAATGMTICAERCAILKAVAGGARKIKVLAVCAGKAPEFISPCGACRQCLVEWGDFPVHLMKLHIKEGSYESNPSSSKKLLPDAFTPENLTV